MKLPLRVLFLCLLPFSLFAGDDTPALDPYPNDFTPSKCAAATSCDSFAESEISAAGNPFLGLNLDPVWVQEHYAELRAAMSTVCAKLSTCFATPGNPRLFCNDLTAPLLRSVCDAKFSKTTDAANHERCRQFMEIYALGIDQRSQKAWQEAQACAGAAVAHTAPPLVWMSPSPLPLGYEGWVTFYAIDPETHVPVAASITFENQIHRAPANPTGQTATYYPFKLPFTFVEVQRADGHRDLVPPMVTIAAENYPPVKFRLAAQTRNVVVEMTPPVAKLKRGGMATISAKDAQTGEPVELRVLVGESQAGDTNQPIVIDWPKNQKRPEIWARSLFNRYSDVVIAPAATK